MTRMMLNGKIMVVLAMMGFACGIFASDAPASVLTPVGDRIPLAGIDEYSVVVPASPSLTVRTSADILTNAIFKMTGEALPIEEGTGSRRFALSFDAVQMDCDQGYRISSKDGGIVLAGGRRGPFYAVVALLEEDWGCRWFARDCDAPTFPKVSKDALAVVPREYVPPFLVREPLHHTTWGNAEFTAFNRLMPLSFYVRMPERYGGGVFSRFFAHTYSEVVPGEKYFKTHPEFFPLVNGKRYDGGADRGQLCFTAPGLDDVFASAFEEEFRKNPHVRVFGVTANDNLFSTCECPGCQQIIAREGLVGAEIHLANRVARKVKSAHPDWILNTWAYSNTQEPPPTMKPDANVAMFYAPILDRSGANEFVPWRRQKRTVARQLDAWLERTPNFIVWDYARRPYAPFPNFDVIADNARYWREKGAIGALIQAHEFSLNSLDSMKSWVFMKLLWNPDWDVHALMDEFVDGYYGVASPAMREYVQVQMGAYRRLVETGKEGRDMLFTDEEWAGMRGCLARAYKACKGEALSAARVARELCAFLHEQLKSCRPEMADRFERDLATIRELTTRHDISLTVSGGSRSAAERNKPIFEKWEKRLAAARGGEGVLPRYSIGSFPMGDRTVWIGAERIDDRSAISGKSAKMGAKMDWGVQWDFEELMSGQENQGEYVLRARVRAEINAPHRGDDLALGLHICHRGRGEPYPGAAIAFDDLPKEGWGFVYFFKAFMYTPSGSGVFYNTSEMLAPGDFVYLDYIEAIPARDFKDKDVLDRLPTVVF